eukprot:scaffold175913_cov34-Tisochrysis_lutea.AAC.1
MSDVSRRAHDVMLSQRVGRAAAVCKGSRARLTESWCITPYKCWLRRPSGLKKYSCRTLVSEIMGASSTSPSSGEAEGGRSCAARVTTPPPIERPSQKMGVPAGSDAANSSWICGRERAAGIGEKSWGGGSCRKGMRGARVPALKSPRFSALRTRNLASPGFLVKARRLSPLGRMPR